MRAFERMLRRANLPFRSTEGFHPQPRMVFALSLPLGRCRSARKSSKSSGPRPIEPEDALATAARDKSPPGLTLFSADRIDFETSLPVRFGPFTGCPSLPPKSNDSEHAARSVMLATELWVSGSGPGRVKSTCGPYVNELRCGQSRLEIDVWITQEGSVRADEMVRVLGLNHLLDQGAVIERTLSGNRRRNGSSGARRSAAAARPRRSGRARTTLTTNPRDRSA